MKRRGNEDEQINPCKAGDGIAGGAGWGGRIGGGRRISAGGLRSASRAKPQAADGVEGVVDWVEKNSKAGGKTKQSGGTSVVQRIVVAAVVVLVLGGVG